MDARGGDGLGEEKMRRRQPSNKGKQGFVSKIWVGGRGRVAVAVTEK